MRLSVTPMTSTPHAPTALPYDRRPAELLAQTDLLRATVKGADLTTPVPSCGWNLGELLRHTGRAHRWAGKIVGTRAQGPVPHTTVDDVSGHRDEDPAALGAWLAEGAAALAESLRDAGPHAPVWTVAPGRDAGVLGPPHDGRDGDPPLDAANALGAPYELHPAVAYDALAEWMELTVLPQAFESEALMRDLLADGRTLHFAATDADTGTGTDTGADRGAGFLAGSLSGTTPAWHYERRAAPGHHDRARPAPGAAPAHVPTGTRPRHVRGGRRDPRRRRPVRHVAAPRQPLDPGVAMSFAALPRLSETGSAVPPSACHETPRRFTCAP